MAPTTHHVSVDAFKTLAEQAHLGHNRWHESIQPIIEVDAGDTVELETLDAFDNALKPSSTNDDVANADLSVVHPLTGPIYVNGAKPGDLLEIKLLHVDSDPWENWGYTAQVPGFGFLRDLFPDPYIAHWELVDGQYAESPQIPGVRVPCNPFPGIVGLAPSTSLRETTIAREQAAIDVGGLCLPPDSTGAVPGGKIAEEALRTVPPRETGGNMDIKQLTPGSSLFLPVYAEGGLVSAGDVHFAQGDCEACGTAIEMRSVLHLRFKIHDGEATRRNVRSPEFLQSEYFAGPEIAVPRRFYATTGFPLHADGRTIAENLTLAARNALINMIDYLESRGFTRQQGYAICSVAVDLRVSQVVDAPNFIISALLPLDIFV